MAHPLKETLDEHISGYSGVVLAGPPRVKYILPFSMAGHLDMIHSIEYILAPTGTGLYSVKQLNSFLDELALVSADSFPAMVSFETRHQKLIMGKLIFAGENNCYDPVANMEEGEVFILPAGEPKIIGPAGKEFMPESLRENAVVMLYPHEDFARASYDQSSIEHPIDVLTLENLKAKKRERDPSLWQRFTA